MARILLVDDHPDMRDVLSHILHRQGHDVISCESGEAAVAILARDVPAATIIDGRLPGISGLELVRKVRRDKRLEKVVVIVCSADGESAAAATEAGADEFWLKGMDDFFELVEKLTKKLG